MKLFHYVKKGNTVLQKGILSFAKNSDADLRYYYKRSGGKTSHEDIVEWMEKCFEGRSRGIRMFSEPIKWTEKSLSLKNFIEDSDLFSINLDMLEQDGLLEAIYVSPSVMEMPELIEQFDCDEILKPLSGKYDIDYSPIDWSICDDQKQRRFAFVRYYLIVVKGGIIPPKYLVLENIKF